MTREEEKNNNKAGVKRKAVYVTGAIVILAGLAVVFYLGVFAKPSQDEEIVARVNGEEIAREDFLMALEQEKMQYQMQGMDLDSEEMSDELERLEEQVLENYFIVPLLLEQEAREKIDITDADVEERHQEYVLSFGGEDELLEQIEAADMTGEEFEQEIKRELFIESHIQKLIESHLEENPGERIDENVEISAAEVEDRYDQIRERYDDLEEMLEDEDSEIPEEQVVMQQQQLEEQYGDILAAEEFTEVESRIESMIRQERIQQEKQEKEQRIVIAHVEKLMEKSDIEKNL